MGILSSLREARRPVRRSGAAFPAADIGRLTSSWTVDPGAINRWLRYEIRTLRARSRMLARGDGYGAKFVASCMTNIAGPRPFVLQSKARFSNGGLNQTANDAIEEAHEAWATRGVCDVTGKFSLAQLHRLIVRTVARDGEALLRKVIDRWGLRLQLIDVDRLASHVLRQNRQRALEVLARICARRGGSDQVHQLHVLRRRELREVLG